VALETTNDVLVQQAPEDVSWMLVELAADGAHNGTAVATGGVY